MPCQPTLPLLFDLAGDNVNISAQAPCGMLRPCLIRRRLKAGKRSADDPAVQGEATRVIFCSMPVGRMNVVRRRIIHIVSIARKNRAGMYSFEAYG